MNRLTIFLLSIFFVFNALAQEIPADSIEGEFKSELQSIATAQPFDTIDTDDKFTKIILYDDHTWDYYDVGRPQIDGADFDEYWNNDKIHAYKEIDPKTLPDEVDLLLVDSVHGYSAPITGHVRSRFQFRRTREHKGTDIPLTVGDPIRAAFDGKVRIVLPPKMSGGYGNLVVIRHPNGLETYYGHLSRHNVVENDVVKAGEIIGYGGNTGRSTGPHLHFETRYHGQAFDPERIINFETGELRDTLITIKKHYFSIYSHYGQTDEESIQASQRIVHVIRSGDTLSGLAAKYHTTVKKICSLNGFSASKTLRIGQRVIVR